MRIVRSTALGLCLLTLPAAAGTDDGVPPLSLQAEELNRTLREIAALLREQVQGQQTDQLMKRIELRRRSLAPLESELRGSRSELDSLRSDLRRMEAQQEFLHERIEKTELAGKPVEESGLPLERKMIDMQIEEILIRMEGLERRIFELENDLIGRRAELQDWEDLLDEALGLR